MLVSSEFVFKNFEMLERFSDFIIRSKFYHIIIPDKGRKRGIM